MKAKDHCMKIVKVRRVSGGLVLCIPASGQKDQIQTPSRQDHILLVAKTLDQMQGLRQQTGVIPAYIPMSRIISIWTATNCSVSFVLSRISSKLAPDEVCS